jgi:mono/diheme cytochrome c family protein
MAIERVGYSVFLRALLVGLLFVASSAVVAGAGEDEPEQPPTQPLVEGRQVFEAKGCSHCHAVLAAKGEQPVGPDLGRGRSWRDFMQLAGALWNHAPAMIEKMRAEKVARVTLSPEEMGKVAAYLFYLSFLDEPADAERGRELFESRSCARCHQFAGRGGTSGPRLDELAPYASSLFMAQALWNHGPEMATKMAALKIERPRLDGTDVANLVAFIRGSGRAPASLDEISSQVGSPRGGKTLFSSKGCVKCHAIDGKGGSVAPDLGVPRPVRHVSEMVGALWNHGPAMWAKMEALGTSFPKLSGPEMSDLLSYLYFIQYMDVRGDATRGAKLFREKSCADCHVRSGGRPAIGPDLAASKAFQLPLRWASALWNHAPAMAEQVRAAGKPWPRFDDDEMRDLVAFLRSEDEER